MSSLRSASLLLLSSVLVSTIVLSDTRQHPTFKQQNFALPIDAVSFGVDAEEIDLEVSGLVGEEWTAWKSLTVETEFDPLLRETNLILFPKPVAAIRLRGSTTTYTAHPIRISSEPIHYSVASRTTIAKPKIYSRSQWGADESLLYEGNESSRSDLPSDISDAPTTTGTKSQRVKDCEAAQREYPEEFKPSMTVKEETDGQSLRWARQYSPKVSLLVVHHTALQLFDDPRPPVERMRALYAFHAQNRGWGDLGYHYVIDEEGQIYEGRSGGDYVVGGHAYCANIGSIGVALMGNFDLEQPTQIQMKSLKWLLDDLARRYNVDLKSKVRFHGTLMSTVIGHKDLVSTDCPGFYVKETLAQLRTQLAAGDLQASIKFPDLAANYKDKTKDRRALRIQQEPTRTPANVTRRTARISRKMRTALRQQDATRPTQQKQSPAPLVHPQGTAQRRKLVTSAGSSRPPALPPSPTIRIRLGYDEATATLRVTDDVRINGTTAGSSTVTLSRNGGACSANAGGTTISDAVVRIDPAGGITTIESWSKATNRFYGVIECRVIDGKLVLINELPLEDYIAGLAEEPDTEPWEKQRAFAIAARTYAAHYTDPKNRKFPGMPYDGDDSPARFQAYGGVAFQEANPRWVAAVRSTAYALLTIDGAVIRPAYFSSDDGRTRSPEERGWNNFPFAYVFGSKPDPWCAGQPLNGHGVGMSGCGAEGQALDGKTAEQIVQYYYPGTELTQVSR